MCIYVNVTWWTTVESLTYNILFTRTTRIHKRTFDIWVQMI